MNPVIKDPFLIWLRSICHSFDDACWKNFWLFDNSCGLLYNWSYFLSNLLHNRSSFLSDRSGLFHHSCSCLLDNWCSFLSNWSGLLNHVCSGSSSLFGFFSSNHSSSLSRWDKLSVSRSREHKVHESHRSVSFKHRKFSIFRSSAIKMVIFQIKIFITLNMIVIKFIDR